MKKKALLQHQAIQAAKLQDWPTAITCNQSIVELDCRDISALNRLALAHLQTGNTHKAQQLFAEVLTIDKSNVIAQKQLEKIKKKQLITVPSFTNGSFIEDPGKTKTINLHRLASKTTLEQLKVGSECELVPKSRYISVEIEDQYIGALPEDLSYRLTKLIKSGNKYGCHIRSVNGLSCSIFLRETVRSKRNQFVNSFPVSKSAAVSSELDDMFLLDEDIPVQIVDTDNDDAGFNGDLKREE